MAILTKFSGLKASILHLGSNQIHVYSGGCDYNILATYCILQKRERMAVTMLLTLVLWPFRATVSLALFVIKGILSLILLPFKVAACIFR